MFPPAQFGPEGGILVVIAHQHGPGVEVVQEVWDAGPGVPYYTVVSETGPGVKAVMLPGGAVPAFSPQAIAQSVLRGQQEVAAVLAERARASGAAHGRAAAFPIVTIL